jgi:peptide/nickel transport system substrate-binding protein
MGSPDSRVTRRHAFSEATSRAYGRAPAFYSDGQTFTGGRRAHTIPRTKRRVLTPAGLVVGAALLLAAAATPHGIKEGGTFLVAFATGRLTAIDPALPGIPVAQRLLAPACATLVAYPNKPPPAGYRLEPSLAEAKPLVSRGGRTYAFTIRKDARFSDGTPVTARAFARALERILTPAMESDFYPAFEDIVGARKMLADKTTTLAGAVARGRTLTLRLTKPIPDLLLSLARLCAVPSNLPTDPEGARAPLPSPAPYYVGEYVPGERLVLERNRFYAGERPHHVARFVANLASDFGPGIDQVESGAVDLFLPGQTPEQTVELARRYGVNRSRFFIKQGNTLRVFGLNNRALFGNNPKLRQAVNFAVDRQALAQEAGPLVETPADQYLVPSVRGYRNQSIYPLKGPDLRRARTLAKGHLRGGKAVLYTIDQPGEIARAQILQRNLKAIGLEVEIKAFPLGLYFEKINTPGEPFDLARIQYGTSPEPIYMNFLFGDVLPRKYHRLLDRASRLTADDRYRAYGDLDGQISRDAAPMIPVTVVNAQTFVSARVDCIVLNPTLDLTAVCLK